MATRVALSPAQQTELAELATRVYHFAAGPAALAIAQRAAFMASLMESSAAAGMVSREQAGQLLASASAENGVANVAAGQYAQMLASLRAGQTQLTAWVLQGEPPTAARIGVATAGATGAELGLAFVPVLWAVSAVVAAGATWKVGDLLATSQLEKARADRTRAETAAAIQQAISAAPDPMMQAKLADALTKAQQAANGATPGFLDKLASGVSSAAERVTSTFTSGSGSALLVIGAIYLLARNRR